jgi:hypothetical protein
MLEHIMFISNFQNIVKRYNTKQVEVYAVLEDKNMIVITVMAKYF